MLNFKNFKKIFDLEINKFIKPLNKVNKKYLLTIRIFHKLYYDLLKRQILH